MSTEANDTAGSAYSRVFSATSDAPTSAKSIATATGLPYKQVTAELAKLEGLGYVAQSKDGSRTVWARADNPPADAPADVEQAAVTTVDSEATADVEPIGRRSVADILATLDGQTIESLKRDALVALCADMDIATNPRNTKAQLVELANQKIEERKQQERDAARPDFAGMKVAELRDQAKTLKVAGTVSKMPRADLIAACDAAWDAQQDEAESAANVEHSAELAGAALTDAESDAAPAVVPDGPWGTPVASDAPSGSVSAVLADLQAARPVSAPPAVSASPRRTSNRPAGGVVSSGAAPAWARGQCEATLLAMMQVLPDAEHSATSLVKAYNDKRAEGQPIMQPGSTAFALDAMVKKGTARLTQEKPKRYAAAVVPIPSA